MLIIALFLVFNLNITYSTEHSEYQLVRVFNDPNKKSNSREKSFLDNSTNELYVRDTVPPYIAGHKNYAAFRIPTLLADTNYIYTFAQGRLDNHEDFSGAQHIVFRRSKSRGKSWKPMKVLAKGEPGFMCGSMSPVLLGHKEILIMWVEQHDAAQSAKSKTTKVFTMISNNGGKSWSTKTEVTNQVRRNYNKAGTWFGVGPSSGLVKKYNPHKGRIIIVASQSGIEIDKKHNKFAPSHLLISDDRGKTWSTGATMKVKSKEATVVELSSGDLMINARNNDFPHRIVGLSTDGGATFKIDGNDLRIDDSSATNLGKKLSDCGTNFKDCGVHSGLLVHRSEDLQDSDNLIFSNPQGAKVERTYGTLQLSRDNGKSWNSSLRYTDDSIGKKHGYSGYSNLALLDDGQNIAILFERGGTNPDQYFEGQALIENETWQINFNTFEEEGHPKALSSRTKKAQRRHHMIDFKIIPFAAFTDKNIKKSIEEPNQSGIFKCVKIDGSLGKIKSTDCQ